MRRVNLIHRTLQTFVVLALAGGLIGSAIAQEKGSAKGGASQLIQLKPIKTEADLAALEPGDMIAMSCPKCKTITVTYVTTEKGHIKTTTTGQKHLCPGCETEIETKGHGKAKKDQIVHVCRNCGSKNAFCCVMKKGSGPTKGMEEKK